MAPVDRKLLGIYLNDHLAALTAGVEVADRSAASNKEESLGPFLSEVRGTLEAERAVLIELMERLELRRDRIKESAGWAAEKVGRLKLNGRLVGYSPLSRVTELEAMLLTADSTAAMWRSLAELLGGDPAYRELDFGARATGLETLRERIERQRRPAVQAALGAPV